MKKVRMLFSSVLLLAGVFFVSCAQWPNNNKEPEKKVYKCSFCDSEYDSEDKMNNCSITEECPNFWYEIPVNMDGSSLTSNSNYIYFGVYPKTRVEMDSDLTIDDSKTVTMGANTYYKGSDGKYYAQEGGEYYRVEPISWYVSGNYNNSGTRLCHATEILTASVFYPSWSNRTIDENSVSPNNYKYSTIRAFLNGKYEENDNQSKSYVDADGKGIGFLQTAFTDSAQSHIANTNVSIETKRYENVEGQGYYNDDGKEICEIEVTEISEYTSDKIFILSKSDLFSVDKCPTDYAISKGVTVDSAISEDEVENPEIEKYGSWWLRTPSMVFKGISTLGVTERGSYGYFFTSGSIGVVPALCLSKSDN